MRGNEYLNFLMLCVQDKLKIRSRSDNTSVPKVKDLTVIIVWRLAIRFMV